MNFHDVNRLCGASLALLLAACATTTFTASWKAPDAMPLQFRAGDKVVGLVMADSISLRLAGEASLARELDRRGLKGIPAYSIVANGVVKDEAKARAAIEASGAVGIVVLRPLGTEQKITSMAPTYYGGAYYGRPVYGGFWGGGYYDYGWGGAWDPAIRTDTYVSVETLVYDLRQNKLVWAGQTKTINPKDVDGFVAELADAVAKELRALGLIAGE